MSLGLPSASSLSAYSADRIGGEAHGDVLDERGVDAVERELHGQRPGLLDLGDVLVQAHPVEIRELGRISLTERVLWIEHAIKREQHVVGVEVAGRLEVRRCMKFHTFTQVKGVLETILGNVPLGGQTRYDIGRAFFELDQTVVDRFGGVVIGGGGVLRGIETCRAAFRAEHQTFAGGETGGRGGQQAGAQQCGKNQGMAHDAPSLFSVVSMRRRLIRKRCGRIELNPVRTANRWPTQKLVSTRRYGPRAWQ